MPFPEKLYFIIAIAQLSLTFYIDEYLDFVFLVCYKKTELTSAHNVNYMLEP